MADEYVQQGWVPLAEAIEKAGTYRELRDALSSGAVSARVVPYEGIPEPVPAYAWISARADDAERTGVIHWTAPPGRRFARGYGWSGPGGRPQINEASLLKHFQPKVVATNKAEQQCKVWLVDWMLRQKTTPPPKPTVWAAALAIWGDSLSKRGFDRAWILAAQDAKTPEWIKSGRRKPVLKGPIQ